MPPITAAGPTALAHPAIRPHSVSAEEQPRPERWHAEAVEHLYVHVPFCARRCSYCDFSIAVRKTVPVDTYLAALGLELSQYSAGDWLLHTLYLGGGTPSQLGGDGVARVIAAVAERAALAPGAEITIEANPDDVTPAAAHAWRLAGVNRVSLGAQSFDQDVLSWMHRGHSAAAIGTSVRVLRDAGIANISIDLIFALPPEVPRDWERDLDLALQLAPKHVSLYGLTVEPHTPLARWRERGAVSDAPEERYESEFMSAHDRLTGAGMEHYEISNFAAPGFRSRHNSAYWSGQPYAGLGPSAHGFDVATRRWNVAPYAEWERRLAAGKSPMDGLEILSPANRAAERVYLCLRTDRGLPASDAELELVRPWVSEGWATVRQRSIVLTPSGMLRLDALAACLTHAGSP